MYCIHPLLRPGGLLGGIPQQLVVNSSNMAADQQPGSTITSLL